MQECRIILMLCKLAGDSLLLQIPPFLLFLRLGVRRARSPFRRVYVVLRCLGIAIIFGVWYNGVITATR